MESKNYFYETDNDFEIIDQVKEDWKYLAKKYSDIFRKEYSRKLTRVPLFFNYKFATSEESKGSLAVTYYLKEWKGKKDVVFVKFDLAFLKAVMEMDYSDYVSLLMHEMIHCRTALEDHKNPNEHKDRFWNYADIFNYDIVKQGDITWNITEKSDMKKIEKYLDEEGSY